MATKRNNNRPCAGEVAARFHLVGLMCWATCTACGTDVSENPNSPVETESEFPSDASGETEQDLPPDTDSSSERETSPEDTEAGPYARGIAVTHLEANQGAATFLIERGTVIPPQNRTVGLIMGRPLLLRAYWERGAGFRNRNITAELRLHRPSGSDETFSVTRQVAGVADGEQMDGTFTWHLEKEWVLPGVTYQIALKEADSEFLGAASPPSGSLVPAAGPGELGVINIDTELKIVMVPFQPPDGTAVSVSESDKKSVEDTLLELSAAARVTVTWKDPVLQESVYDGTDEPWDALARIREADGAGPNVYYHGLLNKNGCCTGNDFQFTGLGGYAGDTQSEADVWARTAVIPIGEDGVGRAAVPIVHELGHNQGRRHAPCGGGEDPDPDFPYPDGGIGRQGWSILSDKLYSADPNIARPYADIMGYCQPTWYSDYNFEAIRLRTATLSSWGLRREVPRPYVPVLKVSFSHSGYSYHLARAPLPDVPTTIDTQGCFAAGYQPKVGPAAPLRIEEIPMTAPSLQAAVIYLPDDGTEAGSVVRVHNNCTNYSREIPIGSPSSE